MTALAAASNVLMQRNHEGCRGKGVGGIVTDAAIILRGDVIQLLGGCDTCVMTGCAVIGIDARVAEGYAGEAGKIVDVVTRRAIQDGRHMTGRLSNTDPPVMARRAVVGIYTHVIKRRARKVHGVMAHGTVRCGW